jgi:hypothetical protein
LSDGVLHGRGSRRSRGGVAGRSAAASLRGLGIFRNVFSL